MTTATKSAALTFIREELSVPDGRKLAETLPDDLWIERDVLEPILATDDEGLPLHRLIWIELARGHGKTSMVAGIAIAEALSEPGTDIFCIATDRDQAALVHEAIEGQCRRNPRLAAAFKRRQDRFEARRTGSRIRIMSSDVPSFFGVGVDARRLRIIADELSQWPSRDLFDAALTTLPKIRNAQLLILSNAGVRGTWQEELRANAEASGYYLFSAPGVIASWISEADLERVRQTVPEPVYDRFYRNIWVEELGQFVPLMMWDDCKGFVPPLVAFEEGMPSGSRPLLVVALDAAVSGDCFSAVTVSRDPDRPEDAVCVRDTRIWSPPRGGTIDYQGPWDHLVNLCAQHDVFRVVYDPYQLHDFAVRFSREHGVPCVPFDQGAPRARADSDLFQLIRSKRVKHDGDPGLREHIANCGFKIAAAEDSRARLVKRGKGKIDAAVSLSMASAEILRLLI